MWRGNGEVLTRVRLPSHLTVDATLDLHPALLDACLHAYPALVDAYGEFEQKPKELRRTHLPIGIEHFRGSSENCGRSGFTLRDDTARSMGKLSRSISRSTGTTAVGSRPSKGCR